MWKIRFLDHADPKLRHYRVSNPDHSFSIYPNLGCSLQRIEVNGVELLDGISDDQAGLEDYGKTFKSALLFPFPNRTDKGKFNFEGHAYQLDCNDPLGNAIHGLVYDQAFALTQERSDSERAELVFAFVSNGNWQGYPFPFELRVTYRFLSSGKMLLSFEAVNTGKDPLPFGLGWHPYFNTAALDEAVVEMPVEDTFKVNDKMIPEKRQTADLKRTFKVSNRTFDQAFTLKKGQCSLKTESYQLQINFGSGEEGYLQLYTPPHRKSIAIEPMTCLADALNNGIGLQTIGPGASKQWSIELNWQIKR